MIFMNEIKIFNNEEFGQVRMVVIDNEPWFVGKDVAIALGYSNTKDALKKHVDEEDKQIIQRSQIATLENNIPKSVLPMDFVWTDIPNRGLIIINESGLYSLILSSKLPSAKKFKHWVTSEVLPSIRKNGGYIAGQETLSDEDLLAKAVMVAQRKIEEREKIIAEQKETIAEQQETIKKKSIDNKALSGKLLDWADRDRINAGIRKLAASTGTRFGDMYKELYKNIEYSHKIYLNSRLERDKKKKSNASCLDYVKDNEWAKILKTFCAMCEAYEKSPNDMMQQTTPKNKLSVADDCNNDDKYVWLDNM